MKMRGFLRFDACVEGRHSGDVGQREVERRRTPARVDIPFRVERRRPDTSVAHVINQRDSGVGDEHMKVGRDLSRRRPRVGVQRGRDGVQMVVGRGQPVLLDVANRDEHLLCGGGQTPRGSERPRLEESRDCVSLQEPAASNSRRSSRTRSIRRRMVFSIVGVCAPVDQAATNIERTTTILLRERRLAFIDDWLLRTDSLEDALF
jgi:hypothetical protein